MAFDKVQQAVTLSRQSRDQLRQTCHTPRVICVTRMRNRSSLLWCSPVTDRPGLGFVHDGFKNPSPPKNAFIIKRPACCRSFIRDIAQISLWLNRSNDKRD